MQVPLEARKGCQISSNWSYSQLWAMDVGPLQEQAVSTLNHWAISSDAQYSFMCE